MSRSWNGSAERDLIMASWASTRPTPIKPDWPKTIAIMGAWGYDFTAEALKSRWSKYILKGFKAKQEIASALTRGETVPTTVATSPKRKAVAPTNGQSPAKKARKATPKKSPAKRDVLDDESLEESLEEEEDDDDEDLVGDADAPTAPNRFYPRRSLSKVPDYKEEKVDGEKTDESEYAV